ncbi:LysR family transcriptional regulator [Roseococcus sp. DSY-14]|uniref:LysR family transcriptional regulator n=1 Tax=Roseococcus sp. DSY-14 TaxID=3369650 RepID=UPI00387B8227
MPSLNYHHLRHFWTIAREGGLTRAAAVLHVAPSALSAALRALEAELGQPLFERRSRRMELTEAGRIALDHAETIFRTGGELLDVLRGQGTAQRRILRVGAVATLSRNFVLGVLRPFAGRGDVELALRSGTLREMLALLDALALDLVLTNAPVAEAGRTNTLLAEQPLALVGRPGKRLRLPHGLAGVPLLLPGPDSAVRQGFELWLDQAGVRPRVVAEVDDMALLRLLAREGHGIALVPPIVVQDELRAGLLAERAKVPGLREGFYAVTPRRRFPNPLVAEMLGGGIAAKDAPAAPSSARSMRGKGAGGPVT